MPYTFERVMISSFFLAAGFLPLRVTAQEFTKEQVSQPSCRYCPNPEFPAEGRKAKISSAKVLVEVTVTEKGDADPNNIRVTEEDPSGYGFAEKAMDVVKKWKFNPATDKDGKPIKITTTVHVQFTSHAHEKH